jgi:hypothetical protein
MKLKFNNRENAERVANILLLDGYQVKITEEKFNITENSWVIKHCIIYEEPKK